MGKGIDVQVGPAAPEVFALPGELAAKGGFQMAICLDEFQQIRGFNGESIENALRNAVQVQRGVGYVFAGSQPSLMEEMLAARRPFHKAGPRLFLSKIPPRAWEEFITREFARRGRATKKDAVEKLLSIADLIPYDVQRLAHELWDYAELRGTRQLDTDDVQWVARKLVAAQAQYYERLWEQLSLRQRVVLQALAARGAEALYSESVRQEHSLGPASSVQKALAALESQDIIGRYQAAYFFLDPLFAEWVRERLK